MVDYLMVNLLLILIHLLLAEEHARESEQAGGAVAQHKLRRNVEPAGQSRVVHARIQRTRRHIEVGVGCQIGAVLRGGGVQAARCRHNIYNSRYITRGSMSLAINMICLSHIGYTSWTTRCRMSNLYRNIVQSAAFLPVANQFGTVHFIAHIVEVKVCDFSHEISPMTAIIMTIPK